MHRLIDQRLADFAMIVAEQCIRMPEDVRMLVAVEPPDEGEAIVGAVRDVDEESQQVIHQVGEHSAGTRAAIATRIDWTPVAYLPTKPAWLLVAVAKGSTRAEFFVKQETEKMWSRLAPGEEPLLGIETAASLRAWLVEGKPPFLRKATKRMTKSPNEIAEEN